MATTEQHKNIIMDGVFSQKKHQLKGRFTQWRSVIVYDYDSFLFGKTSPGPENCNVKT